MFLKYLKKVVKQVKFNLEKTYNYRSIFFTKIWTTQDKLYYLYLQQWETQTTYSSLKTHN